MKKSIYTESQRREIEKFTEEFKARGGMSTEELITRLGAIPFDEFMRQMREKIRNYKK